ncbi:MAG: hypothetical protein HUJ27_14895 [Rhodobacteraceae bacterium]|nr:hypothetical protein [Paracoccaceae bacterium]
MEGHQRQTRGRQGRAGRQVYHVRTDHIGRPVLATDGTGAKLWEASYLPFGGVHVSSGTPMDLRFPGQWFQAESGLHQNWMRDYDPTTGRYIQADPLGLVAGASLYGYALQNPNTYVDPNGENPLILCAVNPRCLAGVIGGLTLLVQYWTEGLPDPCDILTEIFLSKLPLNKLPGFKRMMPGNGPGNGSSTPQGPGGPAPNLGNGPPHGGPAHNQAIDDEIRRLRQDPSVDNSTIRKHQAQVDVNGNKLANTKPDIQYDRNTPNGCVHYCVEYDHRASQSAKHRADISRNDPNAVGIFNMLP